jgi:hypothetical protein
MLDRKGGGISGDFRMDIESISEESISEAARFADRCVTTPPLWPYGATADPPGGECRHPRSIKEAYRSANGAAVFARWSLSPACLLPDRAAKAFERMWEPVL